jgi:hypothetical protein
MKILNMTEAAALIEKCIKSATDVQADIHIALVSCLDHIREHGNTTGALRLLNGLPRGLRVKGAAEWLKHFSNGKASPGLNPQTKQWQIELAKDRTDADFNVAESMNVTFADLTEEKNPTTLTADKFLKNLKRIASNTSLNKDNSPKVAADARAMAMIVVQFLATKAA